MTESAAPLDVSDVQIDGDRIMLRKYAGGGDPLNIYNLVQRMDIYESITNYTLSADIYISEGIELLNNFPMNGEEFISFSMQTPSRKKLTFDFFVESIEGVGTTDNAMLKTYVLRCVTKDFLKNSYTLFSKRYTDLPYDVALNMVIKEDLGSGKPITIEATKGKFDYVVNNVRPFQVVDLIKERAVSNEKNKSSVFFFYEDNEGYKFVTLEKLITERKSKTEGPGGLRFFYDTANRASNLEQVINVRNILSYETMQQGSSIQKVRSGRMANQVRQFDILHGTYFDKYEYNNMSDASEYKKTDEDIDFNSSAFNADVTSNPGRSSIVFKDGTRPEMEHNKNIHWKRPFQEKIAQYGLTLRVYGDSNILVGDMVEVNIPDISGTTKERKVQEIFSKNFIIVSQNHMLIKRKNDGRFDYYMNLDVRKPNLRGKGIG